MYIRHLLTQKFTRQDLDTDITNSNFSISSRFYRTPQNITLGEGATAQFRCASHDAQVTWGKDGLGLPRKAVFLNAESIYIPEVRLEDTGYYECSVNNTSGVVVSRAYLYVQGTGPNS